MVGLIRLVEDIRRVAKKVSASGLGREAGRSLLKTYIKLRLGAILDYRLGRKKNEALILGQRVQFLDHDFFFINFNEVFLEDEYLFESAVPDPVIVDCGSNIGLTVHYFKLLYPRSVVIAFEPQPDVFEVLKGNMERNRLSNVTLINAAVVGKDVEAVSVFSNPDVPGDLGASTVEPMLRSRGCRLVGTSAKAVRLSQFLPDRVDLLKMDIEGAEYEVLAELGSSLLKVDQILMEYHHAPLAGGTRLSSLIGLLEREGYHCLLRSELEAPLSRSRERYHRGIVYAYRPASGRKGERPCHRSGRGEP